VNLLDNSFRELFVGGVKDVIETGKVISGLNNIIDIGGFAHAGKARGRASGPIAPIGETGYAS
jgi:hypothetical protein